MVSLFSLSSNAQNACFALENNISLTILQEQDVNINKFSTTPSQNHSKIQVENKNDDSIYFSSTANGTNSSIFTSTPMQPKKINKKNKSTREANLETIEDDLIIDDVVSLKPIVSTNKTAER